MDLEYEITENLKICIVTVKKNQISFFEKLNLLFFDSNYEHIITSSDNIIIDFMPDLIELNLSLDNDPNIIFTKYPYGNAPNLFPKSIKSKKKKFNLSYNEPFYNSEKKILSDKYIKKSLQKLIKSTELSDTIDFINLKNFINNNELDNSYYNCSYYNIYDKKISFTIGKIKYIGEQTSKYVICYNSELFGQLEVITILKYIFGIC